MFVQFVDGKEYECSSPIAQRSVMPGQWRLIFTIFGISSSDDFDEMVSNNNLDILLFLDDDKNVIYTIQGYNKVSSAIIRYGDTPKCEVHFSKIADTNEGV